MSMDDKKVSVVVPAYNCAKTIKKTIMAVLDQENDDLELIVVDDGSTDDIKGVVRGFKDVKYLSQVNSGPASARNLGASDASGDVIFFTDSDCIPEKGWVRKGLDALSESKVAVVSGSYGIANKRSLLARCIHKEIVFRHDKLMPKNPKSFGSYNFAIKRDVFREVGGFNAGYRFASGEDNDLSYKIVNAGYKIFFERDMIVEHHHPERLGKYLSEQFRHGFWRAKLYLDHPKMSKGDDYTFWKDIVEIPFSAMVLLLAIVTIFFFNTLFINLLYSSLAALFLLELYYSLMFSKNVLEIVFMTFVMFLRTFSRMLGFSSGVLIFIVLSRGNKDK